MSWDIPARSFPSPTDLTDANRTETAMTDRIDASINEAAPPADMAPALQALWWLRKGGFANGPAWERAHEICQASEGVKEFDWIHALAHWIEGDTSNAAYWYRRAGEAQVGADPAAEWDHIAARLSA